MAAATQQLGKSDSCVAVLNYDDVELTATSITAANISGETEVILWIIYGGGTQTLTIGLGQTSILELTTPITMLQTTANKGGSVFQPQGIIAFGMGVGVDLSAIGQ